MLVPKKVKHRKWHTMRRNPKRKWVETRGTTLAFGSHGLKAMSIGRVRSQQIESARKVISRATSKVGKMWIRVFPDMPFTGKPAEVGMGKGKGDPVGYQVQIKPGRVLFEVDGISDSIAAETLRKAGKKLSVKTKVVTRHLA